MRRTFALSNLVSQLKAAQHSLVVPDAAGSQVTEERKSGAELDLQDPSQTVVWGGRLPSRRRAIVGGLSGLAIGRAHHCLSHTTLTQLWRIHNQQPLSAPSTYSSCERVLTYSN